MRRQLKIDEAFAEREIPADDSARLIGQIVEEMDLAPLMSTCNDIGCLPATSPFVMTGILFVDGTKIAANANRCGFVRQKSITKHEVRL